MSRNFFTLLICKSGKLISASLFLCLFGASIFAHDTSLAVVSKKQAEEAQRILEKSKTYLFYCAEFAESFGNKEVAEIEIKDIRIEKDSNPKPAKKLSLTEILTGLKTQGNTKETQTLAARNVFIARRIYQMGVDFPLTGENEKALRDEGAREQIISAIQISEDPWVIKLGGRRLHPADTYVKVNDKWMNLSLLLKIPVNGVMEELSKDITGKIQ